MIQNLSPINKDRTGFVLVMMMTTISHLIQKKDGIKNNMSSIIS